MLTERAADQSGTPPLTGLTDAAAGGRINAAKSQSDG